MGKNWYIHIDGDTIGPLNTDAVAKMLKQNRLNFTDYCWTAGQKKWARVCEQSDFSALVAPYPKVAPPDESIDSNETNEQAPVETPTPKAPMPPAPKPVENLAPKAPAPQKPELKPEPKLEPAPKPEPEPELATKPKPAAPKKWPAVRKFIRVDIQGIVVIDGYGEFNATNLSEGGVFLSTDREIPIGTDLRFELRLREAEKPMAMTGVVIRTVATSDQKGFAVEFTRVNPAYRRIIQSVIQDATNKTMNKK